MRLVIDLDVLLADFRFGEALFAERLSQCDAAGDDVARDHRIAGFHREGVAELRSIGSGRVDAREVDRSEAILRPRLGRQHHAQLAADLLRSGFDDRVVIALRPEQLGQEIRVRMKSREQANVMAAMDQSSRGAPLSWIAVDRDTFSGKMLERPTRPNIPIAAQEQLVVELYSK